MSTPWLRMRPGTGEPIEARREREIIQRPIRDRALQELQPAIPDELKAFQDYTRLAQILDNLGERRMADQVRAIAKDESRHRLTLIDIQDKLQRMTW